MIEWVSLRELLRNVASSKHKEIISHARNHIAPGMKKAKLNSLKIAKIREKSEGFKTLDSDSQWYYKVLARKCYNVLNIVERCFKRVDCRPYSETLVLNFWRSFPDVKLMTTKFMSEFYFSSIFKLPLKLKHFSMSGYKTTKNKIFRAFHSHEYEKRFQTLRFLYYNKSSSFLYQDANPDKLSFQVVIQILSSIQNRNTIREMDSLEQACSSWAPFLLICA